MYYYRNLLRFLYHKQIDMKSCLSEASSLNDYDNRTSGLRAQDVFALFLLLRFSFW